MDLLKIALGRKIEATKAVVRVLENTIQHAESAQASLEALLRQSRYELESIQKNCKHDLHLDGHSHNDDAYRCSICGYIEWR